MLIAYMISGPFIGILFTNMNCMQSAGKALSATIISVLRQGVLLIPVLYLLNALFGLNGVIYGQALTDCITVLLSIVFIPYCLNKFVLRNSQNELFIVIKTADFTFIVKSAVFLSSTPDSSYP